MARTPVEWLAAGRVGRPHGLDGSFHVTRPRGTLLALGTVVRIDDDELEIVRRGGTDERPILRLAGHDGREAAELLRGREMLVHRASAPALEVERPDGSELLVPLVRDAVRSVDVRGGVVDVDLEFLGEGAHAPSQPR